MKIVLTGALGHIGSKLIRDLPLKFPAAEFVMIDNMATQRYPSLFHLPKEVKFRFYEEDVTTADLGHCFDGANVVIHMAAITNAAGSFEFREKLEKNNFGATERVANACVKANAALINFSSTSVYGTQNDIVDEDCSSEELKPQSPYAETKLREEQLLSSLGRDKGLRFITCRFGTIFGISPGIRFHTAVNKFCWQAVMGQPVTVWTTALDQVRPYLDLKDASRAITLILEKEIFDRRIYNVLTGNFTVRSIVDIIRTKVPDLRVELVDTRIMNQLSYHVNGSRFQQNGFNVNGDLQSGIFETIELIRGANLNN